MANPATYIGQAATEIMALINSRPVSPRQDEIESIIAKAIAPVPELAPSGRMAQLRDAITALEAVIDAAGSPAEAKADELEKCYKPLEALTRAVWKTSVRTLADLQERALIARHWHRDCGCSIDSGQPPDGPWVKPSDCDDWGERTVAELIHAVLGLTSLPEAAGAEKKELAKPKPSSEN